MDASLHATDDEAAVCMVNLYTHTEYTKISDRYLPLPAPYLPQNATVHAEESCIMRRDYGS